MMNSVFLFLKGVAMGAANVIPGVSGGTIAFVTGIYDKLIASLKAFDLVSIKLLFTGKFKALWERVNGTFLTILFAGIILSLVTISKLFKYLIDQQYEMSLKAFFFGLILASVYSVAKMVKKWDAGVIVALLIGTAIAASMFFLPPANESTSFFYLVLCGVIATSSMLLPGLSGSFVLMLMGNYNLIMIDGVSNHKFGILGPVILGAIVGFVLLSRGISWLLEKAYNQTVGLLTGFIIGSLLIIWPWCVGIPAETILPGKDKPQTIGYEMTSIDFSSTQDNMAFVLIVVGIATVFLMERLGSDKSLKA